MHSLVTVATLVGTLSSAPAPGAPWSGASLDPPPADVHRETALTPVIPPSAIPSSTASGTAAACVPAAGPEYYSFGLFTTKNVPGTGLARGRAEVAVSGSSPFAVALGPDGSYVYDLVVGLDRMKPPRRGTLVAWVTTPDLDRIERIGALDGNLRASGSVAWNKFLVVITWEAEDDPDATTWSGPVAFRGMSRSGMMHTMVGHGALQQENCAAYGYGN